jgi:hypothetical protein
MADDSKVEAARGLMALTFFGCLAGIGAILFGAKVGAVIALASLALICFVAVNET